MHLKVCMIGFIWKGLATELQLDTIVCASPDGVFDACSLPVCFGPGYICLMSCLCLHASAGVKAMIFNLSFFNQSLGGQGLSCNFFTH